MVRSEKSLRSIHFLFIFTPSSLTCCLSTNLTAIFSIDQNQIIVSTLFNSHWELGCIFIGIGHYTGNPWYISIICWKGVWTNRVGTTCGCFWFGRNYGSKPPRGPLHERDFSICYFHRDSSVPNNCKFFEQERGNVTICNNDNHKLPTIIELQLPSFFNNFDPHAAAANFPSGMQAYLVGLTFALVASRCSTPVLATLLGYIAASKIITSVFQLHLEQGIYGYPIEIQALFFFALSCAQQMLKPEGGGKELIERIDKRITALSFHIQNYYWLDFTQLNNIYRYLTEEYSHTAVNKFNVIPESIPDWVFDFMPLRGGYFIGTVSPARMDFRWFLVGNCIAILSSLATPAQATAIMDLIEERWEDLIGEMRLKITYPALEGHQWRIVTGCDPKNTRWSYHNGGTWPVLLWLLTAACIKTGRPQIAKRAMELVEQRISKDRWPEYYDGKTGNDVGKQARRYQTWSIAGYLVAKTMIENPSNL
ncbi:hypothetical protein ACSBR2_029787 [Camellia fascicularis]